MTGHLRSALPVGTAPLRTNLVALTKKTLTLLVTGAGLALLASQPALAQGAGSRRDHGSPRTFAYSCDGLDFTIWRGAGEVSLYLPDRYVVLPRQSGDRDEKYREGDVMFWKQGTEASLEIEGRTFAHCKVDAARSVWEDARLRGVEFAAVGSTPDWSLELSGAQQIMLMTDAGRTRVDMTAAEPVVAGPVSTYRAKSAGHELMLTIEVARCRNSATGETLDTQVRVQLDQNQYHGCGRWLRSKSHGY